MVVNTLVEDLIREIANLEEKYNDYREKEKLVQMEKQAMADRVPVALRASNADKKFVEEYKKKVFEVYNKCREILKKGNAFERAVLYNSLKNSEIPEFQWLSELAEVNAHVVSHNARQRCSACKRYYRNKRVDVLIKGVGVVYEEMLPPCERLIQVPKGFEKPIADLCTEFRSIHGLKTKVKELARKFRVRCDAEYVIGYKNFENIARVRTLCKPDSAMRNCPFWSEKPIPFVQNGVEPFMPEPAVDHFVSDITLDPESGQVKLLPKHGNDDS